VTAPKKEARRYAPRMPPEERRGQILDATVKLIATRGYEAVSMEGIARAAGVTKPVVYDLFGSLADLLDALLAREEERALLQLAELMPTPDPDADPEQLLIDGLGAFMSAVQARPDSWHLSLMPTQAMPAAVRKTVERDRTQIATQLQSIVRWGLARLDVPIKDAEMLVETIIFLAEEAARKHLDDPERYPRERMLDFTASLLASVKR
jgi:AcrR family transcriptional regulator